MCRADYALGKAIRDGQDNGTIAIPGGDGGRRKLSNPTNLHQVEIGKINDFASHSELYGNSRDGHKALKKANRENLGFLKIPKILLKNLPHMTTCDTDEKVALCIAQS